ncbi:HAMP domain-containing histidine kinase [Alteromonas sp. K632G]|jgi:signal transduction histidine kinase|uniref:histidine kinase n=1 Tax=Alteromonas naphthalenivorans TaxID=715451 RepID=F5Z6H6_ALTNA|nr:MULTISPECIES: HAMP domain-containing sensor histidine kinase [Alteromonas]AEF05489.1 GAF sensor signal transduction histidine kinase [Alteromonas naphthalenivorans]MBB68236.1 sensor histidine kinase [Rickettsiales bacterium]MBO7923588.1 HAMP domain-containing histidine kinase [Alteromonas sp. K632G]|tara:strand:- start:1290 stop:2462 length:1173 start_codon:yes stop_codon:yes gene_type:complete
MSSSIERDIRTIQSIEAVPHIMKMLSDVTGLRFICVARVTEDNWTMCAVYDQVNFNLIPGDQLDIKTTFCSQVRKSTKAIVIEHAKKDDVYRQSEIPKMYGFESYFSFPIYNQNGDFFGTLCGLDPRPAVLKTDKIESQIKSFAELISRQMEVDDRLAAVETDLISEQAAAKLREQYIAILGHDLRTPLSALKMGVDFLVDHASDATSQKVLARMDNSAKRMTRLISGVMDFTHGQMGKGIQLNVKPASDLKSVLVHTVSELSGLHPDREILADIIIDGTFSCDPERISQLLSNLLINAIVHGDAAQPIKVMANIEEETLTLSVSNGGTPISADVIDKLFHPFWRNEKNKKTGGLGLGLFIASQIAEAHKGSLMVHSDENETVFSFKAAL